jgi:hypothetical protein
MKWIVVITIFIMICSCKEEKYYDFSEEENEMFVYEEGEWFSMLTNDRNDTIIFEITKKHYQYDGVPTIVSPQTQYFQMCEITFNSDNALMGSFYGDLSNDGHLNASINITKNNMFEFSGILYDTLHNHDFNGKNYSELFVFAKEKGKSPMLYFSKEQGIVYIDSTASGNSYSLIEYRKKGD